MEPIYFATPEEWYNWLRDNHTQAKEVIVGYYKKDSKIPSIDWPQSVDGALCFGWIDGIRRSIDAQRYCIRFTPRRKNSIWSQINLRRIQELDELGLLTEAGRKVWEERKVENQNIYSFEQEGAIGFSPAQEAEFRANAEAWANWERMAPSYRRVATWLVVSAKQAATQARRLETLIAHSQANERIPSLRPRPSKP